MGLPEPFNVPRQSIDEVVALLCIKVVEAQFMTPLMVAKHRGGSGTKLTMSSISGVYREEIG
jgi:hypothetical protein